MQRLSAISKKSLVFNLVVLATLACAVLFILPANSDAYPRKVLFEDYTSTTCPPCAAFAADLERALEQVEENVVPIGMHMSWPAPGNDPWYNDNPTDNDGRRQYYGVNSIPKFFIDGTEYAGDRSEAAVRGAILARSRVASPLSIEMEGRFMNGSLIVDATVTSEENLQNLTLQVAIVEEYVFYAGATQQRDHYDSMVKMIPSYRGTSFNINANASQDFHLDLNMEGVGWHELAMGNLILVAYVQGSNHTVYQSQNRFFPAIAVQDWEIVEGEFGGDGDGRAEPGETAGIVITVENGPNRGTMENVTVTLNCDNELIEIISGSFFIESIEGGESVNNGDSPLLFRVSEEFIPRPVTFNAVVTDVDGASLTSGEYTFTVGWTPMLIIDASNDNVATAAIMENFDTEKFPFVDRFDHSEENNISIETIQNYPAILWHSHNARSPVITAEEENAIMDYLDQGGLVIFSSMSFVINRTGSQLMSEYFGAELSNENTAQKRVRGVEGDQHFNGAYFLAGGDGRGGGAGDPSYNPTISALEGSRVVLERSHNGTLYGSAGIVHTTENYRSLLLSFPIESVEGHLGSNPRIELIERIWDWTNNPNSSPFDESATPVTFSLDPAFPNPFNSQLVAPFSLPVAGQVSLKLFNMAGGEVFTLMNSNLGAGNHRAVLNADDANLSSGVYFLQLESSNQVSGQKILYIR